MRKKYKKATLKRNFKELKKVNVSLKNQHKLQTLTSTLVSRAQLGEKLGQSFAGDRKLYEICGYPLVLTFGRFMGRYTRQDVAKRVNDAYPDATWRGQPKIFETEDEKETSFEKSVIEVFNAVNLWHYFSRVDKVAGIGRYGVLFLGLDDANNVNPQLKAEKATTLLYVSVYSQEHAVISKFEADRSNERYGLPVEYELSIGAEFQGTQIKTGRPKSGIGTMKVHWSRVVHIAEGTLENDVYGTPRLEVVYNRLQDIELITAGSAEMFWRGGYPGISFEMDADADLSQSEDVLEDEMEEYIHGLSRYMRLQGIKANQLDTNIADPEHHLDMQLKLISAATGIPLRILTGSERGELASSQDSENWNARVDERRKDFAEPNIIDATIDRLIEVGVLDEPGEDGYQVEWPDMGLLSQKDRAEVALSVAKAVAEYAKNPGTEFVIPPKRFIVEVLGFTEEQAEVWQKEAEGLMLDEEENEIEWAHRHPLWNEIYLETKK